MPRDTVAEAANLDQRDRAALKTAWEETFGSPPPPYLSARFMRRALVYDRQCRAQGGLPAPLRRRLEAIAKGEDLGVGCVASIGAGAHLVREWNGRTYRVEAVEGGSRMDGRTYRSLSAVARRITGTAWSGPRFFGLSGRRGS